MAARSEGTSAAGQPSSQLVVRWNLRRVMAEKGMFATTDLVGPLAQRGVEMSRQMVHRVVTKPPQRINLDLLAALCDILECNPKRHHRDRPRAALTTGARRAGARDR